MDNNIYLKDQRKYGENVLTFLKMERRWWRKISLKELQYTLVHLIQLPMVMWILLKEDWECLMKSLFLSLTIPVRFTSLQWKKGWKWFGRYFARALRSREPPDFFYIFEYIFLETPDNILHQDMSAVYRSVFSVGKLPAFSSRHFSSSRKKAFISSVRSESWEAVRGLK